MPLSNFKMSSIGKVLNLTYEERRTVREHISLVKKLFIISEKYVVTVSLFLNFEHLQYTATKNPIYIFLFWELRGLGPSFNIHVSVSDLYNPRFGPHIFLQQNRQIHRGNI